MLKGIRALAAIGLCACLAGCTATAEELTGQAEGYGGPVKVVVTMEDDKITRVNVTEHSETEGIGTRAIDELPGKIVAASSADVDVVSGATYTSRAIMAAVKQAIGGESGASPADTAGVSATPGTGGTDETGELRTGLGMSATGRKGPGTDDAGNQVWSFNVVFASVSFDAQGRIRRALVDQLEVATPNYDGATMPHFSGFPGQGGYAYWDDEAGRTVGTTDDSEENYLTEIADWTTKRMRGDAYKLSTAPWHTEMDAFQQLFVGKTVDEVEAWFEKNCSDTNGRPLTAQSSGEGDAEKYAALTEAEKQQLADVTSSATMSLRDSHGDILLALRRAWENAQ